MLLGVKRSSLLRQRVNYIKTVCRCVVWSSCLNHKNSNKMEIVARVKRSSLLRLRVNYEEKYFMKADLKRT